MTGKALNGLRVGADICRHCRFDRGGGVRGDAQDSSSQRSRLIRFARECKPVFAVRPLLQKCAASVPKLWWTKRKIGIVRLQEKAESWIRP